MDAKLTQAATLYDRIGGAPVVDRLVEGFYLRIDTLPEAKGIRDLHQQDLAPIRDVLKRFFTEWMGGSRIYSSERGHPRLRARHLPFKIGTAERDAWLLCMRGALDEAVADAAMRDELYGTFARLADWMRNQPD